MDRANSIESTRSQLRPLNKAMPDTSRAFSALTSTVHAPRVLDAKTKNSWRWPSRWQIAANPVSAFTSWHWAGLAPVAKS